MSEDVVTASWGAGPATWSILVHGGAGDVAAERLPTCIAGCERAAAAGAAVLAAGGSALDAVQRAVEVLENDPSFNAGTGACLNEDGAIELDASIMDGATLRAGAVCALPPFANPVAIARRVMDASRHVLLAGDGAVRFAEAQGFVRADPASMITELARTRLAAARSKPERSGGTVGAVARDASGHVAAATSTGGTVNKLVGRVGDSPIVGAGTYADDGSAACSTTGDGEAMIRVCLAKTLTDGALASTPETTARAGLARMFERTEGSTGGAILAGRDGSLGLARTTRTMSWAAERANSARTSGA
jgi:beta-aspartyl-peptidase (threonine type)